MGANSTLQRSRILYHTRLMPVCQLNGIATVQVPNFRIIKMQGYRGEK